MSEKEVAQLFGQWKSHDTMCDARQAEYDYEGAVSQDDDIADWQKPKRIGAVKIG